MTGSVLYVSGGFGPVDERYPTMSPSLRARLATADAEFDRESARVERQRREAQEAAYERAVLAAAREKAAAEGLPLNVAMRTCGRTRSEALAHYSALGDVQAAREEAQQARQPRQLAVDAGLIDMPTPPERMVQTAARMAPRDEPPEMTGRVVRAKWLRREHRGDLR